MKYLNGLVVFFSLLFTIEALRNNSSPKFNKNLARTYAKFSKIISCASKPLKKNCENCRKYGYKPYYFFRTTRLKKYPYKAMIYLNDRKRIILLSFSGPNVNHNKYVKFIYSSGWKNVRRNNFLVEKEYFSVYYRELRGAILRKIRKILKTKRKKYLIHFTGHGIGGALATLSAFDLTKNNIIKGNRNKPLVITFGQPRIGNLRFVEKVNRTLKQLFRVVKRNDFISRIPNCYLNTITNKWRCFNNQVINKFIKDKNFPLKLYYKNYFGLNKGKKISRKKLINLYKKHLTYSQPLGFEIMLNPLNNKYKTCGKGRSNCEKKVKIPNSFSINAHNNYFGIKFNKC